MVFVVGLRSDDRLEFGRAGSGWNEHDQLGLGRLDAHVFRAGTFHDAGAGAFLWWYGALQERAWNDDAQHILHGLDHHPVGAVWLHYRFW